MALWEYKVITSGPHGFASPALLETHLNTLGKDEWEIIHFQTLPNNPLAFHGLARRSTTRDWVPPEIAAAPAPQPRPSIYEPPAKSGQAASRDDEKPEPPPAVAAEAASAPIAEKSLRTFRDTDRDQDPDAPDEEDWDNWEQTQDELPTFFEAIKPLLRKNQKGPGQSAPLDHLARRWELKESDIVGALKECGLTIPETEEQDPEYFEFEGDLYWVNRNNRGQLFINAREKPRPVFRTVPANKLSPDDPAAAELVAERTAEKAELEKQKAERAARQAAADAQREAARLAREKREAEQAAARAARAAQANAAPDAPQNDATQPSEPLPEILEKIRPHMRRNRRGPGASGSISFLARALDQGDADLTAAFTALGLVVPENQNDKPAFVEIGRELYWLNKDSRGGVWINTRNARNERTTNAQHPTTNAEVPEAGAGDSTTPSEASARHESAAAQTALPLAQEPSASEPSAARLSPAHETQPASAETSALDVQRVELSPSVLGTAFGVEGGGEAASSLAAVRLLLKPNKRGSGVSGEIGFLARTLEKSEETFLATLTSAGLVVPPDSEAKPTFVEHAEEIFWINKNSTDGSLWLNAKAAKSAAKKSGSSRPRARKPKAAETDGE